MCPVKKFDIVDTTLRDGEQSAGLVFSEKEMIAIAKALDKTGVKWIEAGTPAMGIGEQKIMSRLFEQRLSATLIAWNRANKNDILASVNCGFSWIHISLPVSDLHIRCKLKKDRNWVIEKLKESINFARSLNCTVTVGAEDASRADPEFFLEYARAAAECGAVRIRYADTVGCFDSFTAYTNLKYIAEKCPLPIEFHGHNDFGLAVANTISAYKAGVALASCTLLGIGERAGNADMQKVIESLKALYSFDCGIDTKKLAAVSKIIPPNFCPSALSRRSS